jgi:hypothetical protein
LSHFDKEVEQILFIRNHFIDIIDLYFIISNISNQSYLFINHSNLYNIYIFEIKNMVIYYLRKKL